MSALFLVFIPVGLLITAMPKLVLDGGQGILEDPDFLIMLGVLVCGLIVYQLSRTEHYVLSAVIVVCIATISILATAMPEENQSDYVGFYYLTIPILIASIIFSVRLALLIAALDLAALYLIPLIVPEYTFSVVLVGPFRFVFTISVVILLASIYRNRLEKDRQIELAESEARYRALMEQSSEGIVLYDLDSKRVLESNPGVPNDAWLYGGGNA